MWEKIFNGIRWLFTLQNTVEEHDHELRELREGFKRNSAAIEELRNDFNRLADNERHEREKICLRLENALLNFERRLPPVPPKRGKR